MKKVGVQDEYGCRSKEKIFDFRLQEGLGGTEIEFFHNLRTLCVNNIHEQYCKKEKKKRQKRNGREKEQ